MNLEEMKKYMKFGMKIAVKMSRPAMNELAEMQFSYNGFSIALEDEADVVVTDNKALAERHHATGKKVVVQLLDLPPAVREAAEIHESDRFALFDVEGKGFGAFSEAIVFLRLSPHTAGSDETERTTQ